MPTPDRLLELVATLGLSILISLALVAPAARASARGVETATCASQSKASFPQAFSRPEHLAVGPLAFWHLREIDDATVENLREHDGWKSPALVRPGHTVTVSVGRSARSYARLQYVHVPGGDPSALRAFRAQSDVDGRPVTFWSGFVVIRKAAFLPLTTRVDRRRARHRELSVADAECASSCSVSDRSSVGPLLALRPERSAQARLPPTAQRATRREARAHWVLTAGPVPYLVSEGPPGARGATGPQAPQRRWRRRPASRSRTGSTPSRSRPRASSSSTRSAPPARCPPAARTGPSRAWWSATACSRSRRRAG